MMAGDFNNSAKARSPMLAALASGDFADVLRTRGGHPTHVRHRYPIDWIFARGVNRSDGSVEPVTDVSDHYPIQATFSVPE